MKWFFIVSFYIVASALIVVSNTVTMLSLAGLFGCFIIFAISYTYRINPSFIVFHLGTLLISLTTLRLGGEFFNASDLFYLISALMLIISLIGSKDDFYAVFIKGNPFLAPLVIFVIGGVLSMFNSADASLDVIGLGKFVFLFGVWLPVAIYLHDSETKIKFLLLMVIVASLLPIISNLSDYFLHTRITFYLDHMLKLNLKVPDQISFARFGSVMGHPNNFASLLIVVFPISLWLVLLSKSLRFKLCSFGFLVGVVVSLIISGSRAGLATFLVEGVVFYGFLLKKKWLTLTVLLILGIIIILNLQNISDVFPQSPAKRLATMLSMELGDYSADIRRVASLKQAVSFIREHPITGIGVGHAAKMTDQLYVHNTLFRFWASIGIFGLVSCLWFYGKPLYLGFIKMSGLFSDDFEKKRIFVIILCAIVGSIVFDMTAPQFQSRFKWISVAVLFSMWNIERRKEKIPDGDRSRIKNYS